VLPRRAVLDAAAPVVAPARPAQNVHAHSVVSPSKCITKR
jgi:hypothetical protein